MGVVDWATMLALLILCRWGVPRYAEPMAGWLAWQMVTGLLCCLLLTFFDSVIDVGLPRNQ